jgi:hypothetical protein
MIGAVVSDYIIFHGFYSIVKKYSAFYNVFYINTFVHIEKTWCRRGNDEGYFNRIIWIRHGWHWGC